MVAHYVIRGTALMLALIAAAIGYYYLSQLVMVKATWCFAVWALGCGLNEYMKSRLHEPT